MKSTIIIGAGLQGICTAYFLAKHGVDVTLLERNEQAAQEASKGNGGYVQAEFPEIWNAPGIQGILLNAWLASIGAKRHEAAMLVNTTELLRLIPWGLRFMRNANTQSFLANTLHNRTLAQYSITQMAGLRAETGIQYDHEKKGALFIFRDAQSLASYKPMLDHLASQGGDYELLDQHQLLTREPTLQPIGHLLTGAIHYPQDEWGNSYKFANQLLQLATDLGVQVRYGATVSSVSTNGTKVATKVITQMNKETLTADSIVIAAGTESKRLAQQLGIKLHIAPAKGYSLTIPFGDWNDRPNHVIADMGVHAGLSPLGDVLRIAGTAEFCGYDYSLPQERIDYLLRLTEQVFPDFAASMDRSDISPFAGLRPLAADGMPYIGASKQPGVFINSGHGGLGWTQAAGSGRALADLMVGLSPEIDLQPFLPSRA